jgi:outer membrane protein assembly factor BamB
LVLALVLVASGCGSWFAFRGDAARTGYQPFLVQKWSADLGALTEDGGPDTEPTVANGVVYAGFYGYLAAFDAGGSKGCTGSPRRCTPMWRYPTDLSAPITSTPAIRDGVVYLATAGTLYAFDATGGDSCSGTPKTCSPLWTATGAFGRSSVAVSGGTVFVGTYDGRLEAFDAAGQQGCAGVPKTCVPVWTGAAGPRVDAAPAVANGKVFVGSTDGKLYVFDATGKSGCSGVPKSCAAIWTAATSGSVTAAPAIAGGSVYVGSHNHRLYAFDANGTTGCSGTPRSCAPLSMADIGASITASPSVAKTTVYVNGPDTMFAYDASGTTQCTGTPKMCTPLWKTAAAAPGYINGRSPTIANGVVYVDSVMNDLVAFDATGTKSCSGSAPKTCAPLWVSSNDDPGDSAITSAASIANGSVYVVYFAHHSFELRAYARLM